MAKCVPPDSTDARPLCGWPKMISHKFVRPPRFAGEGTREDPISFEYFIGHFLPMPTKKICEIRVQRQPLF